MRTVTARCIVSLALLWITSSCVPMRHNVYRPGEKSVERNGSYRLAYVELDDQGDYWEDRQVDRAMDLIDEANDEATQRSGKGSGAVFITFIHGWRNNASPANEKHGNLLDFKDLLAKLSKVEEHLAVLEERKPRPLMGIYIAWRGDSLWTPRTKLLEWLDIFTFWNRNSAATRIASRTPATNALLLLLRTMQGENTRSRSIVVGHSMGGLILEKAISQALAGLIIEATYERPQQGIRPPADLIVMVNSAAPALHARHLVETFEIAKSENYEVSFASPHNGNRPLLLAITALNDQATKLAFPLGISLDTKDQLFRTGQTPSQRYLATRTAGHTRFLQSHKPLDFQRNTPPCDSAGITSGVGLCESTEEKLSFTVNTDPTRADRYTLTRYPRSEAFNRDSPYWILNTSKDVVDGHSGIFTPEFVNFLRGLVIVSGAMRSDEGNRLYLTPAPPEGTGSASSTPK